VRVNQSIDDPTFLQLNDRSSELPFCCKRGHSAILPSLQFFLAMFNLNNGQGAKAIFLRLERARAADEESGSWEPAGPTKERPLGCPQVHGQALFCYRSPSECAIEVGAALQHSPSANGP